MKFYHISLDIFSDIKEFIPRIPIHRMKKEDETIPRVCISTSIENCLCAVPWGHLSFLHQYFIRCKTEYKDKKYKEIPFKQGFPIIVYEFDSKDLLNKKLFDSNYLVKERLVPDAGHTKEHWVLDAISPSKKYYVMVKDENMQTYKTQSGYVKTITKFEYEVLSSFPGIKFDYGKWRNFIKLIEKEPNKGSGALLMDNADRLQKEIREMESNIQLEEFKKNIFSIHSERRRELFIDIISKNKTGIEKLDFRFIRMIYNENKKIKSFTGLKKYTDEKGNIPVYSVKEKGVPKNRMYVWELEKNKENAIKSFIQLEDVLDIYLENGNKKLLLLPTKLKKTCN